MGFFPGSDILGKQLAPVDKNVDFENICQEIIPYAEIKMMIPTIKINNTRIIFFITISILYPKPPQNTIQD